MRFLLFAIVLAGTAASAEPTAVLTPQDTAKCPQTTRYVAEQIGSYRGRRAEPRKLNELPAATAYMAVYRRMNGCEAPLTMVDYRRGPRR